VFRNLGINLKFVGYTVVVLLTATVLALAVARTVIDDNIVRNVGETISQNVRLQAEAHLTTADFSVTDGEETQRNFTEFSKQVNVGSVEIVRVIGVDSRVLYSFDGAMTGASAYGDPSVVKALSGELISRLQPESEPSIERVRHRELVVYVPISFSESVSPVGVLEIHYDISETDAHTNDLFWSIIGLAVVEYFTALAILSVLIRLTVVRRLKRLADDVLKIAGGDLDVRTPVGSTDEVGMLATGFNSMAETIQRSSRELEDKVRAKTAELSRKVAELERSKEATAGSARESKAANAALVESEAKNKALLEGVGDALVAVGPDFKILFVNKSAVDVFRWRSADQAVGKDYRKVLMLERGDEVPVPEADRLVAQCLRTSEKIMAGLPSHLYYRREDGTRFPASIIIAPIVENDRRIGAITSIRDITEEAELDRTKTDFVTIVSHQLRTPLSAVAWYTEMLTSGDVGKLTKRQQEYLAEVYAGNKRMIDLVNSLISVSRIDLGTLAVVPRSVSLKQIVEAAVEEVLGKMSDKRLKVYKQFEDLPEMILDPGLMRVVMNNLLTNALNYTPPGGSVSVRTAKQDGHVLVSVADTGYGIPEADKDKIFTRFFRSENVKPKQPSGSGVGLYVTKAIVERMGGRIWFVSRENEGTEFFVTFPVAGPTKEKGKRAVPAR